MYILLFALLAAAGANAGHVAALSYDIVNTDFVPVCMANAGVSESSTRMTLQTREALNDCTRSAGAPWALVMLAGAAAALIAAALLVVLGGWWVRWRLRRSGQASGAAVQAARARFAQRCDDNGLRGRHPTLWILRPGSRFTQAFTTGVPLRRPMVVLPAAVASGPPHVFDPVVHHELAHVKARDVTLASAAWWSGWSGISLLVIAVAPFVDPRRSAALEYAIGLAVAVVITVMLVAFRAHVLRLREHAADHVAAHQLTRPGDLADLMTGVRHTAAGGQRVRLRAVFSGHPAAEERVRALGTGDTGVEGGFLSSVATALIVMIVVQPLALISMNWVGWGHSMSGVLYACAGLLIGALVMPVWIRRAAGARQDRVRAGWWRPVVGLGVGVCAGFLLPGPGMPSGPVVGAVTAHWSTALLFLLGVCGVAGMLAALAHDADPTRRRQVTAATTAGAVVAAVTLSAAVGVMLMTAAGSSAVFLRASLRSGTTPDWEILVVFAVIAVLAASNGRAAVLRSRPWTLLRHIPAPKLMLTVTIIATAAGTVISALRMPEDPDTDRHRYLYLLWQRWWVSALAGGLLLAILLVRSARGGNGGNRVAVAMTAAGAVTLTSALAQFFIRAALAGGWRPRADLYILGEYTFVPLRLLLFLSLLVVPVSLLVGARWRRPWVIPVLARRSLLAAVTAAICAATMFGIGEMVTGGIGDARILAAAGNDLGSPSPPPPPPPPTPAAERPLTTTRAHRIVAAGGVALPRWTRGEVPADPADDQKAAACGLRVAAKAQASAAAPEVAATAAFDLDRRDLPPMGARIHVFVASYRQPPDPVEHFRPLRTEVQRCPYYTEPGHETTDHKSHFHLAIRDTTPLSYPALSISVVNTNKYKIAEATTTSYATEVVIGHNVVAVNFVYNYFGKPTERRLRELDDTAARVLDAVLAELRLG